MTGLLRLIRGGILRAYRVQTLGLATGLTGVIKALAEWAVGDLSLLGLIKALGNNWALIAGGCGLAALGAKVERKQDHIRKSDESVSAIADRALRR